MINTEVDIEDKRQKNQLKKKVYRGLSSKCEVRGTHAHIDIYVNVIREIDRIITFKYFFNVRNHYRSFE